MGYCGTGSHCGLLQALGHRAGEPPGATFSSSAPQSS
jgi:hypothetical protein